MNKICGTIFFCLCLLPAAAYAGPLADQKLLDFLKANGALTEPQVREIKATLDQEDKQAQQVQAEKEAREVKVRYDEGLTIGLQDKSFEMRIGGLIQTDFLMFQNSYPIKNDFDIRRARLFVEGRLYRDFSYRLEYELEGSSTDDLIDAYINYDAVPWLQVRMGQFKEPFSFEQLTSDKNLVFTERSFGYYLTPVRDVGLMLHGSVYDEAIMYGVGVFNGDGTDANRLSQKDSKQVTGRLVCKPLQHLCPDFLKSLQIGGSYSYARLDTSDFNVKVKTPARTTFFTIQPRAKFHMTEDVDDLNRYGLEIAYTIGPMLLMSEYFKNDYSGVQLSDDSDPFGFSMETWYAGMLFMLTGEQPKLEGGVLGKIRPRRNFDIRTGGWGAWGLALMYQRFNADRVTYESLVYEGYSVRKANSLTAALNWYLNNMMRFSLNYSRTRFSDSLFLGNNDNGRAYYRDTENAWMARLQLEF